MVHSVLAVFFQRNLDHRLSDGRGINISGVDFWHAVEFSRNGRFLRTHPLGLSSGRFPSVFPTLSDPFGPDSRSAGSAVEPWAFACRPFDIHYANRFPRSIHNRALRFGIQACGHDEFDPAEG